MIGNKQKWVPLNIEPPKTERSRRGKSRDDGTRIRRERKPPLQADENQNDTRNEDDQENRGMKNMSEIYWQINF